MDTGPTWTDVVTALASVAALVIASIAAFAVFKTNNQQSKQLKHLEEDARDQELNRVRRQADQVATWVSDRLYIYLVNASNQPIYDVTVRFERDNRVWTWEKSVVKPGWDDGHPLRPITTEIQEQSREEYLLSLGLPLEYDAEKYDAAPHDVGDAWQEWSKEGVSIEFRDVSGVKWARDNHGILTRVES
jgi:hypothetical protein